MTVDLGAIRQNILNLRLRPNLKKILMVKADAYGHGLVRVALATQDIVDAFGTATTEEGIALREAGITKDILVMICPPHELKAAVSAGLTVGLHNFEQLAELARLISSGEVRAGEIRAHIKVDTGMHRLGFSQSDLPKALDALSSLGITPNGVYSHMRARAYSQKRQFICAISQVKARFGQAEAHLAASANLNVKSLQFDCVRIGVAAYRSAMTVTSEVVEARYVQSGERVGYGNFKLAEGANIAIVYGGYAEGLDREHPSSVLIRGRLCKVVGRVCMDMFAADTGDFLAEVGESVTLYSPALEQLAAKERKTIEYAVMTCWHGRIKRCYIDKTAGEEDSPR